MADTMETNKLEGVTSSSSDKEKEMEDVEHASKLKNSRKGKLAHLTKRKHILIELMGDVSDIEEVKENLHKYMQLLAEVCAYQELLEEDEVIKDECEWFKPKMTEINTFLSSVSEWISGASKPIEPKPHEEEVTAKDSVSQVSLKSRGSRSSSVMSARIWAEAQRAAIMVKAAALKEKHELEEQQSALQKEMQALKQKREAFELKTQLAISSSKIAVLMSAEEQQGPEGISPTEDPSIGLATETQAMDTQIKQTDVLQSEGKDSMNAYFDELSMKSAAAESEFLSLDKITKAMSMVQTPSVRPKDGVHFQPILERHGAGIKKTSSVQGSSPFDLLKSSGLSESASKPKNTSAQPLMPSKGGNMSDGLTNILQRQNDITSILVKQQHQSKLPH